MTHLPRPRGRGACLRTWLRISLGAAVFIASGCTGSARMEMVSLGMKRITQTERLVMTIRPRKCLWWIDEHNRLCLAMQQSHRSILGRAFSRETILSIVLGEPPAGGGRDYPISMQSLRFRHHAGLVHLRGNSLNGVAAVWDFGKPGIRGRLRLTLRQQTFSALSGWAGDSRQLMVGEFTAVHDPIGGQALMKLTEPEGMQRADR